ncbi:MAG: leucine-rich repeat protein [Treponema sp.]|nr:leucine-rich repeat protein [Treponema sp.]
MKNTAIQTYRGGVFLSSILAATVLTLFSACDSPSSSWEEPVRDYFDKYTNTAAIEKQEISFQTQKDNSGTTCIPSDGNKTITFYLRNPRLYTLETSFSEPDTYPDIQIVQDMQDKTVIRLTYSQDYLLAHEGGQQIGGTIYLTESETLREFDPYSFSLKCNTPPPGVKGQSVQTASNGHFWVCFYVPTTELATPTHCLDTHTVFINGEAVATIGTDGSITAKPGKDISTTAPSGLAVIPGSGASAFSGSSAGCTALYYNTGRTAQPGEFIRWNIYLEDDDGFKSKTVNADSIVTQVIPTITSTNDVLTCEADNKQTTLTPIVDIGTIASCSWSIDSSSSTAEGELTPAEGNNATFTATTAGLATLKATITLAGGREVTATKTIRVLGLTIPAADEIMIVDEADTAVSPTPAGFPATPTYTWHSSNNSVATVDSSGKVHAVSNGNATITAEASYGGKTVTSNQKNIYVYKVGNITGDSIGFAGDGTNKNEMLLNLQIDKPSTEPIGISTSQNWTSSATSVAATPSITSIANQRKVEPLKAGTTKISVSVTIGSKSISSPRTINLTIYGVSIAGNSMLSKTGSYNNLTLTPSLKSGTSTYSGSEIVTYSLSSSAPSIATTNDSAKKVTAKAEGEATITVTATIGSGANQKVTKATKKVNVIDVTGLTTFIAGEEARALTATTKPSDVTYTWSRTNVTGAATINSSTGKISATAKGNVTITLTANRTGSSSDKCEISKTISISEITLTGFPTEIAVGEEYECSYSFDPACSFTAGKTPSSSTKVDCSFGSPNTKLFFEGLATGTETFTLKLTKDGTTIQYKLPTITVVAAHEVSINNLSTWLSNQPATTVSKPYKVKITGLDTALKAADIKTALKNNSGKYVDLSETIITDITFASFTDCTSLVIPPQLSSSNTNTSMSSFFKGCINLKVAPEIPAQVQYLDSCFEGCTSLKEPPVIPSGAINMAYCFQDCTSLKNPPNIPNSVQLLSYCFKNCSAMTSAPQIPGDNMWTFRGCFWGCSNMAGTVTIKATITDEPLWDAVFLNCPNVTKVYVPSNTVKNAIPHGAGSDGYDIGISASKIFVGP